MQGEKQKQIFKMYTFVLVLNGLTTHQTNSIIEQAKKYGCNKLTKIECPPENEHLKLKADYLLAEQNIDCTQLKILLPPTVIYKEALNIKYIQACIKAKRILKTSSYRLKGQNIEDQEQQIQSSGRKKIKKEFVPLEIQDQNKTENQKQIDLIALNKKQGLHNNKFIIQELNKLYKVYANQGDKGRKIAYSRAIVSIKSLTKDLQTDGDVDAIKKEKHIGDKIAAKIKELLKTGHIRKLQELQKTDKNLGLQELTRVWGIGSAKAKELYEKGIKSISELRKQLERNPQLLTKNQKIGLKYLEDLQIRIPRKKVGLMFQFVKQTLSEIVGTNDLHDIQVCGSYRRGKPTCGDIDVFITRKDGHFEKDLLTSLVKKMQEKKFLTDHLTMPRHNSTHSCQSYMGICQFKDQLHHRIDIKYYPAQQFAFAVLYFTGSDAFNRKMRLWALQHGYHLSDHGLYKADKQGSKSNPAGPPIKCRTQKQIFSALGLEYKQPIDRDI